MLLYAYFNNIKASVVRFQSFGDTSVEQEVSLYFTSSDGEGGRAGTRVCCTSLDDAKELCFISASGEVSGPPGGLEESEENPRCSLTTLGHILLPKERLDSFLPRSFYYPTLMCLLQVLDFFFIGCNSGNQTRIGLILLCTFYWEIINFRYLMAFI